nr:hypothetical protein [Tanacetum cinerariifolium]
MFTRSSLRRLYLELTTGFGPFTLITRFYRLYEELRQTPGKEGKEVVKIFLEGAYVKYSNGKPYFGGDDLSYLDVALGCFLPWTGMIETINDFKVFDEVRTLGLATWAKCMRSQEAIKSVFPGDEALTDLYMMLQKYKPPREV